MLYLRYSARLRIWFDFRIYQSCECICFLNISGLHKVWMVDIQYYEYVLDSEHSRVLNMLVLYVVLNKNLNNRYLTWFWIYLKFWICQCCTGFCRKRPTIHVWQSFGNSSGSQYARTWMYMGCEYGKDIQGSVQTVFWRFLTVSWMSWVLDMLRLWMYQESKYVIVTKGSE